MNERIASYDIRDRKTGKLLVSNVLLPVREVESKSCLGPEGFFCADEFGELVACGLAGMVVYAEEV